MLAMSVPLEPRTQHALTSIAAEMKMSHPNLIATTLRDWLETNAYLGVIELDDDTTTDGRV